MGIRNKIESLSRPALFAAALLTFSTASAPANAESVHGDRTYGAQQEYFGDGYGPGIVLAHDRFYGGRYTRADRYYSGRTYRRIAPRRFYLHRSKPWRGPIYGTSRFRHHKALRHGRVLGHRAFRHKGFRSHGFRGKAYRYYDRRWR